MISPMALGLVYQKRVKSDSFTTKRGIIYIADKERKL